MESDEQPKHKRDHEFLEFSFSIYYFMRYYCSYPAYFIYIVVLYPIASISSLVMNRSKNTLKRSWFITFILVVSTAIWCITFYTFPLIFYFYVQKNLREIN